MPIAEQIRSKLEQALQPAYLETVNESHMHSGPADAETHFKVTIVSEQFSDMRKVARHQRIYQLLAEELAGPVHALALHTYTSTEWGDRQQISPSSPDCKGGSKLG